MRLIFISLIYGKKLSILSTSRTPAVRRRAMVLNQGSTDRYFGVHDQWFWRPCVEYFSAPLRVNERSK